MVSCNKTSEVKIEQKKDSIKEDNRITAKQIEHLKFNDYVLSDTTIKTVENWNKYQELKAHVEYLKKADFSFFMGEKKAVKNLLDSLEIQLPKAINNNAIKSRIAVLKTTTLRLQNNLKLTNLDKETTLLSIKEFLISFSNLNLRINKKIEFDANYIENPKQ